MKRPGDDGYDFPCGDSHSRIDSASEPKYYSDKKVHFSNHNSGDIFHPTKDQVLEFRDQCHEQIELCNLWLGIGMTVDDVNNLRKLNNKVRK